MSRSSSIAHDASVVARAQKIESNFSTSPSLQEVAVEVLQNSLGRQYSWLNINQEQPVLMEPVYVYTGKDAVLRGHNSLTLADALIERCVTGRFVDYSQGQFLLQSPTDDVASALSVGRVDLERAINDQGARLIATYQAALISYWMALGDGAKPRYLWLAELLKNMLLTTAMSSGLVEGQLDMVIDLVTQPERASRQTPESVRAYIVDQWGESGAANLSLLRGLVLVKEVDGQETVLLYTLSAGIQAFDSLSQLGNCLAGLLTAIAPSHHMQWRLNEPAGNIFRSFSLTFLAQQLTDIQAVVPLARPFDNEYRIVERALAVIVSDFDCAPRDTLQRARLWDALPGWLVQADPGLQLRMSQYAIDLARSVSQAGWKPFDQDVPSLTTFASKALSAQLAKEFTGKPVLNPDRITVLMAIDETTQQAQAKMFWRVPPLHAQASWTLTEFAWLGLAGVDPARLELRPAEPGDASVWLTPEEALKLIEQADVRTAYGQLIEQAFKASPQEVSWRKARFIEQVCLQLPMLALEYHLKYPNAFSRQAWKCVAAVFKPGTVHRANGHVIVLRCLAFKTGPDASVDPVRNMFLIGPQSVEHGPHILFRPMSEIKFVEFAAWDDVLAAIARPGPLQYQVLSWLDASARRRYQSAELLEPGPQVYKMVDYNESLWLGGTVELAPDSVAGDYPEHLFQSGVEAMLSLMNRQQLTGIEIFWDWVKRYAGIGLALVLTFVGGPPGQVLGGLLLAWFSWEDIKNILSDSSEDKASSVVDLLLNIALMLLSRGRVSTRLGMQGDRDVLLDITQGVDLEQSIEMSWQEGQELLLEGGQPSKSSMPQVQLPTVQSTSNLIRGYPLLEKPWKGLYRRLSVVRQAELALYEIEAPANAVRIIASGRRGLYLARGELYARVDGRWFKVQEHEGFHVISSDVTLPKGPELVSSNFGEWAFSAESAQAEDLEQALMLEKQRLASLKDDQQRLAALDSEYKKLAKTFDSQPFPDAKVLADVVRRYTAAGARQEIDDHLVEAQTGLWSANALQDALSRRRESMQVTGYHELASKFAVAAVKARRNQALLLGGKRNLLLHEEQLQAAWFDAGSMEDVVLNPQRWSVLAPNLPRYAQLQQTAIEVCVDAEQRVEQIKPAGGVADVTVASLSTTAWAGRRLSLKWQDLQLRTLALQCFKANVPGVKDYAFVLIQEVTQLCSLKLLTRWELFVNGAFNWDQRLRVLNDVLDTLVLANWRLSYDLALLPDYLDAKAIGGYRTYVRMLFETAQQDVLKEYQAYEAAAWRGSEPGAGSKWLIDDAQDGVVVGNHRRVLENGVSQDYVDVMEPFDHRRLWSFERSVAGGDFWRRIAPVQTAGSASADPLEALVLIAAEAKRLLTGAQQQFEQISRLEAIRRMSPQRVRSQWLIYAGTMSRQKACLAEALEAPGRSPAHRALQALYQGTPAELDQEVSRFLTQAHEAPIRMVMKGSPTSEGLMRLDRANLITCVEMAVSDPLVREFEVREKATGRALWLARLHYATVGDQIGGVHFTRGNLYPYAEHRIGYEKMKLRASTDELRIHVLRTNIDHAVANAVFFTNADSLVPA